MNKKFSTLVASLLLSSAFSVYAGNAKPMLAIPTQVETRVSDAGDEDPIQAKVTIPEISDVDTKNAVLKQFTNNSRLGFVNANGGSAYATYASDASEVSWTLYDDDDNFYWSFNNGSIVNNAGKAFVTIEGYDKFEVHPVLDSENKATDFFFLITRKADGTPLYVCVDNGNKTRVDEKIEKASLFFSAETAYSTLYDPENLNKHLGGGFKLLISSAKDSDASIKDADVFAGKLTAVYEKDQKSFKLKNEAGKYIVFDADAEVTSDGYAKKGQFKVVSADDLSKYEYCMFIVGKADNGSESLMFKLGKATDPAKDYLRFYVANVYDSYVLTVVKDLDTEIPSQEYWAVVSLDNSNYVNLKQYLNGQYVTVDFVGNKNGLTSANKYKQNGRLSLLPEEDQYVADFVDKSGLYEKAPEAQWAVKAAYDADKEENYWDGSITLVNRENPNAGTIKISALRQTTTPGVLEVAEVEANKNIAVGDLITITSVANHDKHDGYKVFNENDLRNETWYLGQVRQTADNDINVYWAENHDASHQIGATVDVTKASRWNMSLVKKSANVANHPEYSNQVDSVLIVSELQSWNVEKNRVDAVKDTLVILPYAFQNRANNEFVKYDNSKNINYYVCDEFNKTNALVGVDNDGDNKVDCYTRQAQRFAIKMKANGAYNFVALDDKMSTDYTNEGGAKFAADKSYTEEIKDKVFQENSTLSGTWSEMDAYAKNANSLMFVEKYDAPEYRKLETSANLDTIKIYRADNEAQVVYEKRDAKSVVDGRTLSFLNIDNDAQFTQINPALYADTAYVNRGNNTRYQYLLGVNIEHTEGYYCPIHGFTAADDCGHAVPVSYNKGRYLINMIDTANVYGKTAGIHNNPYINETEEGRTLSKLSFVDAIHVLTDGVKPEQADKLYVINNGDTTEVALGTESLNTVKFAFKYIDSMESSDFKIQTLYKPYAPSVYGTSNYGKGNYAFTEEGYLRWVNGCLVVDSDYTKGDVFNMDENETRTPTANEEISAEGASVVVAGTNGAVVVKGAEGKNVIVSTILGKVVANEVVSSDNAQITAPAGVVVVSVDGESFKVVVK